MFSSSLRGTDRRKRTLKFLREIQSPAIWEVCYTTLVAGVDIQPLTRTNPFVNESPIEKSPAVRAYHKILRESGGDLQAIELLLCLGTSAWPSQSDGSQPVSFQLFRASERASSR